jgi:hypothetical protein
MANEKDKNPPGDDDAAIAEIKEGAKWMVAALGAIAVVLVGGITLGDLGAVEGTRFWGAVAGVIVAGLSIMHLLHLTIDVLIAEPVRLSELSNESAETFGASLLAPAETPADLVAKTPGFISAANLAYSEWAQTSFQDAGKAKAFREADGMAQQWSGAARRAVSRLRLLRLQEDFKKFRDAVGLTGFLVLIGVMAVAWGLTGPHVEELSIGTVTQAATSVVVQFERVDFSSNSVPDYAEAATEPCVNSGTAHSAVALAANGSNYTLALVESDVCPAVVIRVDTSQAQVALPKQE